MFAWLAPLINRVAPMQGPEVGTLDVLDSVIEDDTK